MTKNLIIMLIISLLAMMWVTRDRYSYETSTSGCNSAAECSNEDGWTW